MKSQKTEVPFAAPIDELLAYAVDNLGLAPENVPFKRRVLLSLFKLDGCPRMLCKPRDIGAIHSDIMAYAAANKLDGPTLADRAFGQLMPLPAEVNADFDDNYVEKGADAAVKKLYDLNALGNYVLKRATAHNLAWDIPLADGGYKVIVDRSGYVDGKRYHLTDDGLGGLSQSARTVPLYLNNRAFDFGFNRFSFLDSLCTFTATDGSLPVNHDTFLAMLEALSLFPKFFFACPSSFDGEDASCLIGAKAPLPVADATVKKNYSHTLFDGVRISLLHYPCTVVRLTGGTKKTMAAAAQHVAEAWINYEDKDADIRPRNKSVVYNRVMPVTYIFGGNVTMDLFPINNRTDKERPEGIFAPHPDIRNIVPRFDVLSAAGVFLLTNDVAEAAVTVREYLTGSIPLSFKELSDDKHPMHKHIAMIAQLANDNGLNLKPEVAERKIIEFVNGACTRAMREVGVFKSTDDGLREFDNFMTSFGCL